MVELKEKCFLTFSRPCRPKLLLSKSLSRRYWIAEASSKELFSETNIPSLPSVTTSRIPSMFVATTGVPHDSASRMASPHASLNEGRTKTDAFSAPLCDNILVLHSQICNFVNSSFIFKVYLVLNFLEIISVPIRWSNDDDLSFGFQAPKGI